MIFVIGCFETEHVNIDIHQLTGSSTQQFYASNRYIVGPLGCEVVTSFFILSTFSKL